jgi:putative membrane protein
MLASPKILPREVDSGTVAGMSTSADRKAGWMVRVRSWGVTLCALLLATALVSGIRYETPQGLIIAAVSLALLHEFVRPALLLLTLPLVLVTLTLFRFVINALLLALVGNLVPGFSVDGFWSAFWGALIMSIVMVLFQPRTGAGFQGQFRVRTDPRESKKRNDDDLGNGPVIDV